MSEQDPLNRCLPKWPQMYTTGKRVTEAQALEIIRRTDTFFVNGHGGNDRKGDTALARRMRMPHFMDFGPDAPKVTNWPEYYARNARWHELWGSVETEYVCNRWISSAYIYGPHGWMHPDGKIGFVDNVGKWPSVEDVLKDWAKIAAEFPYLELAATLMDSEYCEESPRPVVTIVVSDGFASVVTGDLRWHEAHETPWIDRSNSAMERRLTGWNEAEHYPFPESTLKFWESKALEVDAQMKNWAFLRDGIEQDDGDVDDGWRKDLAQQREGL